MSRHALAEVLLLCIAAISRREADRYYVPVRDTYVIKKCGVYDSEAKRPACYSERWMESRHVGRYRAYMNCFKLTRDFLGADSGQDLVEYALILAVLVFGTIAGLNRLAGSIAAVPNELVQKFINAYTS